MLQVLGLVAQQALNSTNEEVPSDKSYDRAAPNVSGDGEVHLLMLALDYKKTSNPLTCTMDARNMQALARDCGISNVTILTDEQCTMENVRNAIAQVGGACDEDDYFVIYYSGHGTSMQDDDGDESDGQDECFCFVTPDGQISADTCMRDDEFSDCVVNAIDPSVRVLVLTDCCHSGTICDLDSDKWDGIEAISIAGCTDNQTSGDMGRGGIFTHSMLLAIDQLQDTGVEDYSVGMLYNATLDKDNTVFNSAQDITIQSTSSVSTDTMAWPLIPQRDYKAPLTQAASASSPSGDISASQVTAGNIPPEVLQQLGINPCILQYVNEAGLREGKVDIKKLVKVGIKCFKNGDCKKDNCAVQ